MQGAQQMQAAAALPATHRVRHHLRETVPGAVQRPRVQQAALNNPQSSSNRQRGPGGRMTVSWLLMPCAQKTSLQG